MSALPNNLHEAFVDVFEGDPITKNGTFTDDEGKEREYTKRTQDGRLEVGGFVYPYDVRLADGRQPYAPGRYRFNLGKMLSVNKGNANWSKFAELVPVTAASK